ncbi:hypothetical protein Mpsy_2034 [Methanolobus psychrophilus R15]|nr:hypothetical protein Mpsy_2034 [Methanolobus psychrophilus R15]
MEQLHIHFLKVQVWKYRKECIKTRIPAPVKDAKHHHRYRYIEEVSD